MSLGFATTLRNSRADAITAAVGSGGTLTIYSGTQPATGGTATTVLVTFTLASPFAASSSGGVLTITNPAATAASATGTASWARFKTAGGVFVFDSPVSATGGGAPIQMNSTAITSGVNVTVTSLVITEGNP